MENAEMSFLVSSYPSSENDFIFVDLPDDFPIENFYLQFWDNKNGEIKCEKSQQAFKVSVESPNELTHCMLFEKGKGYDFGPFKSSLRVEKYSKRLREEEEIQPPSKKKRTEFEMLLVEYNNLSEEIKPYIVEMYEQKEKYARAEKGSAHHKQLKEKIFRNYEKYQREAKEKTLRFMEIQNKLIALKKEIRQYEL